MYRNWRPSNWRVLSIGAAALVIALTTAGCPATPVTDDTGDAANTGDTADTGESMPTGAALFTMISQTDPYQQWGQFADRQGTLPSVLPHGPMSRVFMNDKIAAALANFDGQLPDGSIIVKENVGTSPLVTEAVLTVMWKVSGFDSANNDWFWANFEPDGQIVAEGQVLGCIGCHGGARNNDFVFVQQF